MDFDDELPIDETTETGSDELLSDENLRLPDSANPLVRVHALRAWLTRRQKETSLEIGEAALALQELQQEDNHETKLRRRERQARMERAYFVQQVFQGAQRRLATYEKAQVLLEDCISHTTSNDRVLVEYYLTLDDLMQHYPQSEEMQHSPELQALNDVQHRVEHVGAHNEE